MDTKFTFMIGHSTPDVVDLTGERIQDCCEPTPKRPRAPVIPAAPAHPPAPVIQVLNNHGSVHISHNKVVNTNTPIVVDHKQQVPNQSDKYGLKTCYKNADEVYLATKRHSSQQLCNCMRNNNKSGGTTMVFECTCTLTSKTKKRTLMPGELFCD